VKASQSAVELIKHYEGCKLEAYICPAGVLTIGFGHTGPDVIKGKIITADQAEKLLIADLVKYDADIARYVKVKLNQSQYDALVSFVYNLGARALATSTLLKKLNAGEFDAVPREFLKWDKARVNGMYKALPGLTKRRKSEAALFRGELVHDAIIAGKLT